MLGQELVGKFVIYIYIYTYDILVTGRHWEGHLALLKQVCKKLRKGGMTLKLEKCKFALSEVKFLGYVISERGISADPDKIKAI